MITITNHDISNKITITITFIITITNSWISFIFPPNINPNPSIQRQLCSKCLLQFSLVPSRRLLKCVLLLLLPAFTSNQKDVAERIFYSRIRDLRSSDADGDLRIQQ